MRADYHRSWYRRRSRPWPLTRSQRLALSARARPEEGESSFPRLMRALLRAMCALLWDVRGRPGWQCIRRKTQRCRNHWKTNNSREMRRFECFSDSQEFRRNWISWKTKSHKCWLSSEKIYSFTGVRKWLLKQEWSPLTHTIISVVTVFMICNTFIMHVFKGKQLIKLLFLSKNNIYFFLYDWIIICVNHG